MKALSLEKKDSESDLLEEIKPVAIKSNDPFFSSTPIDIGHTNNEFIDKLLYGLECRK